MPLPPAVKAFFNDFSAIFEAFSLRNTGHSPSAQHGTGVRLESLGHLSTDKKVTGQTLDPTGLYYYNARYYDASIGMFIRADKGGQNLVNRNF
jgi:RHS repeat-associated protein